MQGTGTVPPVPQGIPNPLPPSLLGPIYLRIEKNVLEAFHYENRSLKKDLVPLPYLRGVGTYVQYPVVRPMLLICQINNDNDVIFY